MTIGSSEVSICLLSSSLPGALGCGAQTFGVTCLQDFCTRSSVVISAAEAEGKWPRKLFRPSQPGQLSVAEQIALGKLVLPTKCMCCGMFSDISCWP